MSALRVPDLDALRLALHSGAVPADIACSPATAAVDGEGRLWLAPLAPLGRPTVAALARLGLDLSGDLPAGERRALQTWHQLLPVVSAADSPGPLLADVELRCLAGLLAELDRLRQPPPRWWLDGERAFVLADELPVASQLRDGVRVYGRLATGVWVRLGHTHATAGRAIAPPGEWWLLDPPGDWRTVPAPPEPDPLPANIAFDDWPEADPPPVSGPPIPVFLRLTPCQPHDEPGLWVWSRDPLRKLHAWASDLDGTLADRLAFALVERDGRRFGLLRPRDGRPPVILVPGATAYAGVLKLPNLYLPLDRRLDPSLRRDVVRKYLAADAGQVVWLERTPDSVIVQRTSTAAFRPLADWLRAVAPQPQPIMTAAFADPLALEPFHERPEVMFAPAPPPTPTRQVPPPEPAAEAEPKPRWWQRAFDLFRKPEPATAPAPTPPEPIPEPPPAPVVQELDGRRNEVERLLLEADPRDPTTSTLWPELAMLDARAGLTADAAQCWQRALWDADAPPTHWAAGWARAEAKLSGQQLADGDLERLLLQPPAGVPPRLLAAAMVWAAGLPEPPPFDARLAGAALAERFADLPARAAWLSAVALAKVSGGDSLGLARARDRLLARLHEDGLSLERDVPLFLRFGGQATGRVRLARDWLLAHRDPIHRWIAAQAAGRPAGGDRLLQRFGLEPETRFTPAYADLLLAWGLARLGEQVASDRLAAEAADRLGDADPAHVFLRDAFRHRIAQAAAGQAGRGVLPAALHARLAELEAREAADPRQRDRTLTYTIDKLRQALTVLEPAESVEAERTTLKATADSDQRRFEALLDERDPAALRERYAALWREATTAAQQGRVLRHALAVAPRVGDAFGKELVAHAATVAPKLPAGDRLPLLGRAVGIAAATAAAAEAASLVGTLAATVDAGKLDPAALAPALGLAVRALHRLHQPDAAGRLADAVRRKLLGGGDLAAVRQRSPEAWPTMLRLLLAVAADDAEPLLDAARAALFGTSTPGRDVVPLACGYAAALSRCEPPFALPRLGELFPRLGGVVDRAATNTHYALNHLRVVEAAVLAAAGDDFALGAALRQRLDDDEFAVRQRVHRDVRAAVE